MLHSVNREALEELGYDYAYERLPCPSIFPNLASLTLFEFEWDAHWLAQLSCLPQLRELFLSCSGGRGPLSLLQLPALPALTELTVRLPFQSTLRVVLWPTLPVLQKLTVDSRGEVEIVAVGEVPDLQAAAGVAEGPAALAAPAAPAAASQQTAVTPCAIHTLQLGGSHVTVDFGTLPALRELNLWGCGAVVGASTLAGACALRSLHIDGTGMYGGVHSPLTAGWVTELLRAAPPSLHSLHMQGLWGPQQAEVVGGMTQLRLLALDADGVDDLAAAASLQDSVPPADGVLWRSLSAMLWYGKVPLPEALRGATQLQLLSYSTSIPTLLELDLLAALPALKRLWVRTDAETEEEDERIHKVFRRHLPHLRQVKMWVDDDSGFWDAALTRLKIGPGAE
ncbi:hypothetical protein N2152v2_006631 [Parachlorella kessleri]